MYRDIKERTFEYAVRITKLSRFLYRKRESHILANQVLRSGTSIGANIEEGVAAYSRGEYAYKMNIALKEARETHYWLRLLQESGLISTARLGDILNETEELKKILGAIVSKLRKTTKAQTTD